MQQIPYIKIAQEGKNKWWLYVAGVVLTFVYQPVLFFMYMDWVHAQDYSKTTTYYFNFAYRAGFLVVMLLIIKYLHYKRIKTVFTANSRFDIKKTIVAFLVYFFVSAAFVFVDYIKTPKDFVWAYTPEFLPALLFGFIFITLLVVAEELYYRGYVFQFTGLGTGNKWIAIGVSTLFFVTAHLGNLKHASPALIVANFTIMGLAWSLPILFSNGLEISIGFHLANDIFAIHILNSPNDAFPAPSLWVTPESAIETSSVVGFGALLLVSLIIMYIYQKRYGNAAANYDQV